MRIFLALLLALPAQILAPIAGDVHHSGGGGGGPAFAQACSQYTAGSASPTCVFASNVTSGNVVAGYVNVPAAQTITGVSETSAGSCTLFNGNTALGSSHTSLFTCPVTSTAASTITVTLSASTGDVQIFAQEVSGVTGVDNTQTGINAGANVGVTTATGPTLTPTGSTDYVFVAGTDISFGGGTASAGAGGYSICSGSGTNTCSLTPGGYHGASEHLTLASSSAVTPTEVWSISAQVPLGAMLLK